MRVRHSPCSWLNEIVAPDSVAGNTLTGMLTRLTFRKPFHVARAAMSPPLIGLSPPDSTPAVDHLHGPGQRASDHVAVVVGSKIQARARELKLVLRDLVAQQPPRCAVVLRRHRQALGQIAKSGDDDQRHGMLRLAPGDA